MKDTKIRGNFSFMMLLSILAIIRKKNDLVFDQVSTDVWILNILTDFLNLFSSKYQINTIIFHKNFLRNEGNFSDWLSSFFEGFLLYSFLFFSLPNRLPFSTYFSLSHYFRSYFFLFANLPAEQEVAKNMSEGICCF